MNLYLLRHGIASDPGEDGLPADLPDAERPLSERGRERMKSVIAALKKLELNFDLVASSPLLRARQTAEMVNVALKRSRKVKLMPPLAPEGSPKTLLEELLHVAPRAQDVLMVGHEPYLSRLISLLISGSTSAAIDLRKGGLAKLKLTDVRYGRCATLDWILPPKLAARLCVKK